MVGRLLRFVHVVIIICFDDGSPLYFFFSQIGVENTILRLLFCFLFSIFFNHTFLIRYTITFTANSTIAKTVFHTVKYLKYCPFVPAVSFFSLSCT